MRDEKEALTRQPALGGRERHIVRCQAREPNSFVQVLHRSSASLLDSGCSLLSDLLIHGKPGLHVSGEVVLVREDNTKRRSIFDSLTRPLGLMRLIGPQSLRVLFMERVGVTRRHWVRCIPQNAHLALIPILVRSVYIQPPGHAVNRVPEQVGTIGVQLVIFALQNFSHWDLLKLEPFLVVFCQLRGHET